MKKILKNEKETLAFAKNFSKQLYGGEIIALIGELGSGKTVFTKGMASGLGIKERVQSPTFLLMKIYNVCPSTGSEHKIKHLCHVDAYRLNGVQEIVDIGILDWLGRADTVTVIEWADKVAALIRGRKVIKIKMKLGGGEEKRKVEVISN